MSIELVFNRQDYITLLTEYMSGELNDLEFNNLLTWFLSHQSKEITEQEKIELIKISNCLSSTEKVLSLLLVWSSLQ